MPQLGEAYLKLKGCFSTNFMTNQINLQNKSPYVQKVCATFSRKKNVILTLHGLIFCDASMICVKTEHNGEYKLIDNYRG